MSVREHVHTLGSQCFFPDFRKWTSPMPLPTMPAMSTSVLSVTSASNRLAVQALSGLYAPGPGFGCEGTKKVPREARERKDAMGST